MNNRFGWPGVKCLALDLATKTGFAFNNAPCEFQASTWELGTVKENKAASAERLNRRRDPRVVKLFDTLKCYNADLVVFEDVEFRSSLYQMQLWSSLRAAAWLAFPQAHFECVPVGTLKKFATGHGGATKQMMAKALWRQHPELAPIFPGLDDNAIDAIWLWLWARKNLARLDFSKLRSKV